METKAGSGTAVRVLWLRSQIQLKVDVTQAMGIPDEEFRRVINSIIS